MYIILTTFINLQKRTEPISVFMFSSFNTYPCNSNDSWRDHSFQIIMWCWTTWLLKSLVIAYLILNTGDSSCALKNRLNGLKGCQQNNERVCHLTRHRTAKQALSGHKPSVTHHLNTLLDDFLVLNVTH